MKGKTFKVWCESSVAACFLRKIIRGFSSSFLFGKKEKIERVSLPEYSAPDASGGWCGAARSSMVLQKIFSASFAACGITVGQFFSIILTTLLGSTLFYLRRDMWMISGVLALFVLLSAPFVTKRTSLWQMVRGSVLFARTSFATVKGGKGSAMFYALVALVSGMLALFFGPLAAVCAVGVVAALLFLINAPSVWWVYIVICLVPVIGTTACIVFTVILLISYILNCAAAKLTPPAWDTLDSILAAFGAICVICALLSVVPSNSFVVVSMWLMLVLFSFLMKRTLTDFSKVLSVLRFFTIGASIASVVGFYQYFSGAVDTTWTDTTLFEDLSIRVYSTFANPNVYGEFLLLAAPIAAGMLLYVSSKLQKTLYAGALIAIIVNLALTYSRGCYGGIALTAVVFLWYFSKKLLAIFVVIGVPVAAALMPANMLARIASMVNFSDTSTSVRFMIYAGTAGILSYFWISGIGIGEGAFTFIFPFFGSSNIIAPHSHSLFLQWVVSFGIGGIGLFLLLFWWYSGRMKTARTHLSAKDPRRFIVYAFSSVFAGFMLQSIFDYTWYNYRVFMLFWVVLAIGNSVAKLVKEETV